MYTTFEVLLFWFRRVKLPLSNPKCQQPNQRIHQFANHSKLVKNLDLLNIFFIFLHDNFSYWYWNRGRVNQVVESIRKWLHFVIILWNLCRSISSYCVGVFAEISLTFITSLSFNIFVSDISEMCIEKIAQIIFRRYVTKLLSSNI